MTYQTLCPARRSLGAALIAGLAATLLLAAPAQAQRVSLNDLANDHNDILDTQNHGATPIFSCMTIDQPGSYVVVQNLNAVGDCLLVVVNDVTIDLGGHTLTGDGTGHGVATDGIPQTPRTNISVRNGTVTGFLDGVGLVHDSSVENLRAVQNSGSGIRVGNTSTVSGSTASNNGAIGIFAGFGSLVSGNLAKLNGSDGIGADVGSTVTGNIANNNARIGVGTAGPGTVTYNTALNNGGNGVQTTDGSTVIGNTSIGNNIGLFVPQGSTIANNTAISNASGGLLVTCPSNVIGNTATQNGGPNLNLHLNGCNAVNNVAP